MKIEMENIKFAAETETKIEGGPFLNARGRLGEGKGKEVWILGESIPGNPYFIKATNFVTLDLSKCQGSENGIEWSQVKNNVVNEAEGLFPLLRTMKQRGIKTLCIRNLTVRHDSYRMSYCSSSRKRDVYFDMSLLKMSDISLTRERQAAFDKKIKG